MYIKPVFECHSRQMLHVFNMHEFSLRIINQTFFLLQIIDVCQLLGRVEP